MRSSDWSADVCSSDLLAIVDVDHGAQPLRSADGGLALAVNGEIYNHKALEAGLKQPYAFQTASDCEVINALYREQGVDFISQLNGIFAFALYDAEHDRYLIARDPVGVIPLYYGRDEHDRLWVASEMKVQIGRAHV